MNALVAFLLFITCIHALTEGDYVFITGLRNQIKKHNQHLNAIINKFNNNIGIICNELPHNNDSNTRKFIIKLAQNKSCIFNDGIPAKYLKKIQKQHSHLYITDPFAELKPDSFAVVAKDGITKSKSHLSGMTVIILESPTINPNRTHAKQQLMCKCSVYDRTSNQLITINVNHKALWRWPTYGLIANYSQLHGSLYDSLWDVYSSNTLWNSSNNLYRIAHFIQTDVSFYLNLRYGDGHRPYGYVPGILSTAKQN
eukprot:720_1